VPFHLWTPDVYEGAPAPVTAYIATVSKGAMFAILLRFFSLSGARSVASIHLVFAIMAIASMLTGNLLALLQNNVKRILAYSSIAHLGYLLVAFEVAASSRGLALGASAATFYLVAYFVTTLGAFGIVTALSNSQKDADALEDYRGLFWRQPSVAGIFTAMLLSLAGIPLTAGFLGKFYIVAAGAAGQVWALIIVLVVTSGIGLFYYLRIVVTMFMSSSELDAQRPPVLPAVSLVARGLLVALTILLVWFGVYPRALLEAIQTAVASLL
jgi:NADH-quinone oxidoreductase subunit N